MKKLLALLLIGCMLMATLASCNLFGQKECTEHVDADGNYVCDNCEAELQKSDLPPACPGHKDEDGDLKCDACGYVMFEQINYTLNISDLAAGVRSADDINGKFTIASGTEVRNRTKTYEGVEYTNSVKIGGNTHKILVDVPGSGTLRFIIQNGSSGVDMQFTKVIAPDGTTHDIEFVAGAESNPLVMIELEVTEGQWIITRGKNGGTQDIYYLELECVVAVSAENGFELVTAGQTDFLVGDELDLSKLRLNATYENGKTDALELNYTIIDTSKVDMSKEGVYTITISYKEYTPITYQVRVYAPSMIELAYDAIEKLAQNSSAGNGVYYNQHFREVYAVGEDLDTVGLSVIVIATGGNNLLKFKVDDYEITGFDSSEAGIKELKISAYGIEEYQKVYVIGGEPVAHVKVDNTNGDILPGDIVDGYMTFTTIHQALEYLARVPATEQKILEIGEGLYREKLEIILPNLTIRGAGTDKTTIEWDSLYGLVDAGGFTHTTDSTATVAVREQAVNCVIEDITISNYWNTQERMDEAKLAIERGLALLVQSDRFIMKNSRLLGIQDTLELFTGRQYFENTFISGYTDFIFGTNNTTYFKNCTIHVIDTEKDDKGTAGYITAFKGSNKGESDAITYGAIFDGCKFTADEGVTEGCTAIGRPWGAYAAVAVMNSELGGYISTKGFSTSKNERYVSMTVKPTDETAQFVEYNNTGAGAITEAVAGMRMLTAEEAAKYADFEVIFGKTNRNVTYLDPWNPMSEEVVVDDRTYYYFNGAEGTEGTCYTYTDNIQGTIGSIGDMTIDATKGKLTFRGSDSQMNTGAKLIFNVEGGTLVTVISYPGYGYYTINGIAHNANDTFSVYFAEATEVVVEATGTSYIYQVIINPNEDAPEAPELQQIKVEGMNINYTVGDDISLDGAVVKAYYSDNSIVTVTDYEVDATAVNKAAVGTYDVVFSFSGATATVSVVYEGSNADPAITENIVLDFTTQDGLDAINNNKRITIEEVAGQYYFNNGNSRFEGTISFMVKAGAKIIITPYHDAKYVSYTIGYLGEEELMTYTGAYTYEVDADCTMVYTGLSGNYICSIQIVYPAAKENVSITFGSEGNYKTASAINMSGMNVRDNGGNNSQLSSGSMVLTVYAGATVTVHGYPSYTSYKISDGVNTTAEINDVEYTYTVEADGELIISAVNSNNYFYGIDITY